MGMGTGVCAAGQAARVDRVGVRVGVRAATSSPSSPSGPGSGPRPRGNRAARRRARAGSGGWDTPVCPATAPRPCEARAERRYRRTGEQAAYPHYYVTHAVAFVRQSGPRAGEACRNPVCDDCHNEFVLAHERELAVEWGYRPAPDGVAWTDAEAAATGATSGAPEAADHSASGEAIMALCNALVLDQVTGGAAGVELAEAPLLPESEAALRREIELAIPAAADRGDYDEQLRRARAAREGPGRGTSLQAMALVAADAAAAATAVDAGAVARLVAMAAAGGR